MCDLVEIYFFGVGDVLVGDDIVLVFVFRVDYLLVVDCFVLCFEMVDWLVVFFVDIVYFLLLGLFVKGCDVLVYEVMLV